MTTPELDVRDPATTTPSFDVQQAHDMVGWLRNALTAAQVLAERAGGAPAVWHLQPSSHQFVNLVRRHPGSSIDHVVTWGGPTGAMSRPDAEHAARHHPRHELAIADYHLGLLDQHAVHEERIYRYDGDQRLLVPYATCAYCDTGNPAEAPHMGYPCPTIRGLLRAHRDLPGFNPEWTE
ncbi:DUF6221 family protein [Nonomuraea sp. NPDC026600]|uniref:DUF6221 family protein n=1 Tax=Nonomuraea sp. NPDC026600 TaxID=3155363 RepID=UPI0033F36EAC